MSAHRNQAESELDPDAATVRQRLRTLRGRHPGVVLVTALTHIHDDQVVVSAALTLPDGTSVNAYAAEPTDSSGLLDGAIELASQRATTRAFDLLEADDGAASARDQEQGIPANTETRVEDASLPPVIDALRKASLRRQAPPEQPLPQRQQAEPDQPAPTPDPDLNPVAKAPAPADEPDLADYTWTHFWTWARTNNLSTKGQVEQRINRPIDNLTPLDVRLLLHETGVPL